MRKHTSCLASVLALAAVMWTGAGETDPMLMATELPREVTRDCSMPEPCSAEQDHVVIQWLAKTARGQLFLVAPADCENECRGWLVEKRPTAVTTVLSFTGDYRLMHVHGAYPEIALQRAVSDTRRLHERFAWQESDADAGYRLVSREAVYEVAGQECGSATACEQEAWRAAREHRLDDAVEIFETVHKRSWI